MNTPNGQHQLEYDVMQCQHGFSLSAPLLITDLLCRPQSIADFTPNPPSALYKALSYISESSVWGFMAGMDLLTDLGSWVGISCWRIELAPNLAK